MDWTLVVGRELKRLKRSRSLRLPLTSSQACVSNHRVMDLKQLRYFTLVANTGSIARASAHLGIAAPAISRSIAALETELNCRLFDRDGRGMRLTKTGERLNERAGGILREVELTRQEIAADGHHLTGEIVIGATPAVMALIGQALIERVEAEAPSVRPRLLEGYSGYLQNWALTGVVDLALANGFEPTNPLLARKRLASEQLVAVASPEVGEGTVGFDDILKGPLILPSATNPIRGLIDGAAKRIRRQVKTRLDVDSATLLIDLAAAGFGVAILPYGAVARDFQVGRISVRRIVDPVIPCDLNLIFRRDKPPSKVGLAVIERIEASLAEVVAGGKHRGNMETCGQSACISELPKK